jgi:serine/threonine protein phosphatase PrpC
MPILVENKTKHLEEDLEKTDSQSEDEAQQALSEVTESIQLKKWFKQKFSFLSSRSAPTSPRTSRASEKEDKTKLRDKSIKWNQAAPHQKDIKPHFSQSKEAESERSDDIPFFKSKPKSFLADARMTDGKLRDVNLALLCLEGQPSGKLGVVHYKACSSLQTKAFHKLNLSELLSCHSLKLADIILNLSDSNGLILESKTLCDMKATSPLSSPSSSYEESMDNEFPFLLSEKAPRLIGGSSINNYPSNMLGGQINCDFFHSELHPDYVFSLIADGCNWGESVRLAAQRAVIAAAQWINQMLAHSTQPVKRADNLAWVLVQAMAMAHEAIVSGYRDLHGIGTTTLNICLVFVTPEEEKYLMIAGVGDCKVLLATETTHNQYAVCQVECAKRLNTKATDPGGRLGPYTGPPNFIDPDLRNLAVTCIPLPKGKSIIFNMTDGVHDNLNPEMLGKEPCEIDTNLPPSIKWSDLSFENYQAMATHYQNALFEHLINEVTVKKPESSLDKICEYITEYCHQVTSYGRDFMVSNPSKKEPSDKKLNPGKMDHCSIVAFEVNN